MANANENIIASYLAGLGLSPVGIAAFLGNFQTESNFNPADIGKNDGGPGIDAIGIAQWERGRRTALQNYAKAHGGSETDLNIQLGYLQTELNGGYHKVITALAGVTDINKAAQIVQSQFEGSAVASLPQRQANAATALAGLTGGTVATNQPHGFSAAHPDPDAPFKVGTLHAPLTTVQRKGIVTYLMAKGHSLDEINKFAAHATSATDADSSWIAFYESVVQGGGAVSDPATQTQLNIPGLGVLGDLENSVKSVLSWLTTAKNWERIGLFILGAIILIVTAKEVL